MNSTKKNKLPRDAAFELDSNLGLIGGQTEILFGVKDLLYDILRELDAAAFRGDNFFRLDQVHSRLNATFELMRYSLDDLNEVQKNLGENNGILFAFLVRGEK